MTIKLDLERVQEFSLVLFSTLQNAGLLPSSLSDNFAEYERWPLLLVGKIESLGIEAGYLEWSTRALKTTNDPNFENFLQLQAWIQENKDFFDKHHLHHLRASFGSRVYDYLYYQEHPAETVIPLSEAEQRWHKQNLRGNAKGRLRMWKLGRNWFTTVGAMKRVFGPESKKVD